VVTWKVTDEDKEEQGNIPDDVVPKENLGELGAIAIDKRRRFVMWGWDR